MLSAAERTGFDERGIVRLARAVDPHAVDALRASVQAFVAERALVPDSPGPGFAVTPSKTAPLLKALGFDALWGARVRQAVDDLLGAGAWRDPVHAGQLLAITLPRRDVPWQLPHKIWHLDYTAPGSARAIPGLQVFLCIDTVTPRGGGTLAAAGSHRFIDAIRVREGASWAGRSAEVRKALNRELAWIRDLASQRAGEDRVARFMARATIVDGAPLQVVELCGEPGDVYFMHPWTLHAPSPNCGDRPRMVLTERIQRS